MDRKIIKEECKLDPNGKAHILFIQRLLDLEPSLLDRANQFIDMPQMTSAEKFQLRNEAKTCNHCFEEFGFDDLKVIDHCHYSGRVLGICHNQVSP